MSNDVPRGVRAYDADQTLARKLFLNCVTTKLSQRGYREVEIPTIMHRSMFESCLEGTENRMFNLIDDDLVLIPEVTNYIKSLGKLYLKSSKIMYVARCFRNEMSTGQNRLREFTQVGVEMLGDNSLDCRKIVRADAIELFQWLNLKFNLVDGAQRGINLYDASNKAFEFMNIDNDVQLLGGGPYDGGAGWAFGLERVMNHVSLFNHELKHK